MTTLDNKIRIHKVCNYLKRQTGKSGQTVVVRSLSRTDQKNSQKYRESTANLKDTQVIMESFSPRLIFALQRSWGRKPQVKATCTDLFLYLTLSFTFWLIYQRGSGNRIASFLA